MGRLLGIKTSEQQNESAHAENHDPLITPIHTNILREF